MREILFRGQSIDCREWYEGDLYQSWLKSVFFISYCTEYGDRMSVEVDGNTVGQYTGLTDKNDKNGKKIFEGDICIDRGGNIHLVKYGEFTPKNFYRMFGCESSLVLYGVHTLSDAIECIIPAKHTLEVIGNIHDNPELLKGGGEE